MGDFRHISEILPGIISHLGKGKEKGTEFVCHCPFHEDRTPSFSLNLEKGVYYCFGCRESGGLTQLASKLGISAAEPYRPSITRTAKPKTTQHWETVKRIEEAFDAVEFWKLEEFRKARNDLELAWNERLISEVNYYTKREILKYDFDCYMKIHTENLLRLRFEAKHGN